MMATEAANLGQQRMIYSLAFLGLFEVLSLFRLFVLFLK